MYFKTTFPTFSLWPLFEVITFKFNSLLIYCSVIWVTGLSSEFLSVCQSGLWDGQSWRRPWPDEIADWDALVPFLCPQFCPMILGYCTVVLQTPDYFLNFLSSLGLLMLPGAGHCLALPRLPHLNPFVMLLACAASSVCMRVMHADGDVIVRRLPLETGAFKLFALPGLLCPWR